MLYSKLSAYGGLLLLCGQGLAQKRPNILFIITDDQDLHMSPPPEFMPHLRVRQADDPNSDLTDLPEETVIDKGATFATHFCTVAVCCPSRASLWTGRAAHNTNVTDVFPPYGGYPKVVKEGWNDNNLFLWMQAAGYNTYYTGKLWNAHTVDNYDAPFARGFNESDFLLDPFTYNYFGAVMSRNNARPVLYPGRYNTDLISTKASALLREAMTHDDPWFLTVAPIAPHAVNEYDNTTKTRWFGPPMSAPRHADLFKNYTIPQRASFNKPIAGAPSWVGRQRPLNATVLAYQEEFQRKRLRSLMAVDEMVRDLVAQLEEGDALNNTFIFYTTDNGYHISQHALGPGKSCGYDTDIHIPFYLRGPGIEAGSVINAVTSHTDLAPTILKIAGIRKDPMLDGQAIPLKQSEVASFPTEHATIEYWGFNVNEGIFGWKNISGLNLNVFLPNTYKGVRLIAKDYSLYYAVWCTNEAELYDLKADPWQTQNLLSPNVTVSSPLVLADRPMAQIRARLNALMMVLKSCKGSVCTLPWFQLHPDGAVKNLTAALAQRFDDFYANQPKVAFDRCEMGYIRAAEGPQNANVFGGLQRRKTFEYGTQFHDMWT